MKNLPFWERTYQDHDDTFDDGQPSPEVVQLVQELPPSAEVLDLGCGNGRNCLFLAEQGFRVTALDISQSGIAKLKHRAKAKSLEIIAKIQDITAYTFTTPFDLIIAYGVLHLFKQPTRETLIRQMQQATKPDGYHVVLAFTDTLPPPSDMKEFMVGLLREGELFKAYRDWHIREQQSYILHDEHPGGIKHQHAINRIVARKPNE